MRLILQEKVLALENKNEYRDFKRIADSAQVSSFYKLCCTNLLSTNEWNKLNLFYPIAKISICDRYGFNVNRTSIIGDVLKVEYHPTSDFDNILYLKIDQIKHFEDDEDELFEMVFKVDQKPNLGRFYSYFNDQTTCKIKVRRIISTISIEAKLNLTENKNPYTEENNIMVAQFPWDRLIRNTLSKL